MPVPRIHTKQQSSPKDLSIKITPHSSIALLTIDSAYDDIVVIVSANADEHARSHRDTRDRADTPRHMNRADSIRAGVSAR